MISNLKSLNATIVSVLSAAEKLHNQDGVWMGRESSSTVNSLKRPYP